MTTIKHILLTVSACAGAMLFMDGLGAKAGEPVLSKTGETKAAIDAPKLWAQTCQECHNIWPVNSYSKSQWGVIVHHMQVRACLTGPEARAIAQFLQNDK